MKISIIIPVYNVESYISRCLDSVICQTYQNIECILVDDCGSDKSIELLNEKLKSYSGNIDFKIIGHKKNRGISAARNTGTEAATGDYVYYLDSDDYISVDALELLAEPLETEKYDIVIGEYVSVGASVVFKPICTTYKMSKKNSEIRNAYFNKQWYMMAWNKLIRRDFLIKNKIKFLEGIIHEDNLWSFQLACKAESMAIVDAITYIYYRHPNSIMANLNKKGLDSRLKVIAGIQSFVQENGLVDDCEVARFAIIYREWLYQRASVHGTAFAYDVYRLYVRGESIFKSPIRSLSLPEKLCYLHHYFPKKVGFVYCRISYKLKKPLEKMSLKLKNLFQTYILPIRLISSSNCKGV